MEQSKVILPAALLFLAACKPEVETTVSDPIRTVVVQEAAIASPVRTRAFPAVLQPPEVTPLAFDIGGRLGAIDLRIGQDVTAGDVLATVEAEDATLRLQQAEAALEEAQTAARNAREEADRQTKLYQRGVASIAARDRTVTQAEQAEARMTQALRNLDLLRETLSDTALRAPFDGVIDGIAVQAFGSVRVGQPVLTMYEDTGLQTTIFVSYDVVTNLELGQTVSVMPADGDAEAIEATLTEIGRRAAAVSSFPIVLTLNDTRPDLRSGMAVEVMIDLPLPDARHGIEIPLSAIALNRNVSLDGGVRTAEVFVARPDRDGAATLDIEEVRISAVARASVFVSDGLQPGDLVVTAGVPHLNPGQTVRLPNGAADRLAELRP